MTAMTRDQLLEENTRLRKENSRCQEVKHRYSKILESSRDFVYIHDFDGNFLWGNATFLNKLGYTHEEFARLTVDQIIAPEDLPHIKKAIRPQDPQRSSGEYVEGRILSKSKEKTWVQISASVVPYDGHACIQGIARDVSEVKQALQELQAKEELLRRIVNTSPSLIFIKNEKLEITFANKALADLYGTSVEDIIGKTDEDFSPTQKEIEAFSADDRVVLEKKETKVRPREAVTDHEGDVHWFKTIKTPLIGPGDSVQVLGVATDISDLVQAEQVLNKQWAAYELGVLSTLIDIAYDPKLLNVEEIDAKLGSFLRVAIELVSAEGGVVYLKDDIHNEIYARAVNGSVTDVIKRGFQLNFDQGVAGWVMQTGESCIVNDYGNYERAIPELKNLSSALMGVPITLGDITIGVIVVDDVTPGRSFTGYECSLLERLALQAALEINNEMRLGKERSLRRTFERQKRELQEKTEVLEKVLDAVPHCIFWKDASLLYDGCNSSYAKRYGMERTEDVIGKVDTDILDSEQDARNFSATDQEIIETGIPKLRYRERELYRGERRLIEKSKVPLLSIDGQVVGVLGVFEDITDNLLHYENLVRYITHSFKSRLAIVEANLAILSKKEVSQDRMKKIEAAINLLKKAVEKTRVLVLAAEDKEEEIPINTVVQRIDEAIDDPRVRLHLSQYTPHAIGKYSEIETAILELLSNALDFAPSYEDGGTIELRVEVHEKECRIHVQDNGPGISYLGTDIPYIPPKNTARRGIGLALVKYIVDKHAGILSQVGAKGEGAHFIISLPLVRK